MTTENDLENSEKMEEDIDLKVKEQNQQLMVQFTSETGTDKKHSPFRMVYIAFWPPPLIPHSKSHLLLFFRRNTVCLILDSKKCYGR